MGKIGPSKFAANFLENTIRWWFLELVVFVLLVVGVLVAVSVVSWWLGGVSRVSWQFSGGVLVILEEWHFLG